MTQLQPIIAVKNVQSSSKWYQDLLSLTSSHGGDLFEMLTNSDQETILCLHRWEDHDHPTMRKPDSSSGNGLILYFQINDMLDAYERACKMDANVDYPPKLNKNSGLMEFAVWDLDSYYCIISES